MTMPEEHTPVRASVTEGTMLYMGERVRARRFSDGRSEFWWPSRWVEADPATAATFEPTGHGHRG